MDHERDDMDLGQLTPRLERYDEAVGRWQSLATAAHANGIDARRYEPDCWRVVGAAALVTSGASRDEVMTFNRDNIAPHLMSDEEWERYVAFFEEREPIDAVSTLVVALEMTTHEFYEAIGDLEDLLGVGGDDAEFFRNLNRQWEADRLVREEAARLMRPWEDRNPEPPAPAPWDQGEPDYHAAFDRWSDWTRRSNHAWRVAERHATRRLARSHTDRRPSSSHPTPRDRRRSKSRRQPRAPARPSEDEPDLDEAGPT